MVLDRLEIGLPEDLGFWEYESLSPKVFERIHRTNLIAMGILPIEFKPGSGRSEYSLTGEETYCIRPPYQPFGEVNIVVKRKNGYEATIQGIVRIDSQAEMDIFNKGGVFPYLKSKLIS